MRIIIFFLFFLFIGSSSFAIPLTDPSRLNKHNLSSTSLNAVKATVLSGETRICVFCHTPHGASADSALWNRKAPLGSFSLYNSLTLNIDDVGVLVDNSLYNTTDYPNGASRMCLSCHDGVSAIGEVLSEITPIEMTISTLDLRPSKINLVSSHPISFVYNDTVKDAINAAEGALFDGNYTLPDTSIVTLDGSSRMQCTTCHDPHDDTRVGTYDLPFWRYTTGTTAIDAVNDYDVTCGTCHKGADWGNSWGGGPTPPHSLP